MVNRTYHNLTARYNGYFWAGEAVKEGEIKLFETQKDNYKTILPVYPLGDNESVKNIYPEMDKAYKKTSTVIKRHSMLIKGQERCKWIDDNYLIIGKTHYYKKEYFDAESIFEYVIRQYKKEPSRQEAYIWLARTQIELGRYIQAQNTLDLILNDKNFPKKLHSHRAQTAAYLSIKKNNYEDASQKIEFALKQKNPKRVKARLHFILGQLYQKRQFDKQAFYHFKKAARKTPYYEQEFFARLYNALNADESAGGETKRKLKKMAEEEKNKDYADQIYFTLAQIEKKEGNTDKQIEYLKESVKRSTTNNYQKTESFLQLADLHFKMPKYEESEMYYDSAVKILPADYPDYEFIIERKTALSELIVQLKTINKEDSLQKISKLSDKEKERLVMKMVKQAQDEADRKQREEELKKAREQNAQFDNKTPDQTKLNFDGGKWYFYNPQTVSNGMIEFKRKWGQRKWEDNWRRSNKVSFNFDEANNQEQNNENPEENLTKEEKEKKKKQEDTFNPEYYTKDFLNTPEDYINSDMRIKTAYYKAGNIYKERLSDKPNAIETFITFLSRYDTSMYHLPVLYSLYLMNKDLKKDLVALNYKNIIINQYPNSEYAQILLDPDFYKRKMESEENVDKYYEVTYEFYLKQQYKTVLERCATASASFPGSAYAARFSYLRAMSKGAIEGQNSMLAALKDVTLTYPDDPIKSKADEVIQLLSGIKIEKKKEDNSLYKFREDTLHKFILAVQTKSAKTADLTAAVSLFNAQFFDKDQYKTGNLILNEQITLITVSNIPDKSKAEQYLSAIKGDQTILKNTGNNPQFFLISENNFATFYKQQNIQDYLNFYLKFYTP